KYFEEEVLSHLHVDVPQTISVRTTRHDQDLARVTIVLGANRDGYWNGEKLVAQLHKAIDIFERTHPNCIGIWAFDNATSHTAYSADALLVSRINKGPGGSVPKMRNTIWNGQQQSMIIEEDFFITDKKTKQQINLHGEPKGIKW
ncbi:10576_t:CDS:2, partial [Diversispora eburnea]